MLKVLNSNLKLISVLDNELSEAIHTEQLNGTNCLNFNMTITEDKQVYEGNYIGFKDLDGNYQLFEIAQIEDSHEEVQEVEVYCEHLAYELNDVVVLEKTLANSTCANALSTILSGTRWQVGTVSASGNKNIGFGNTNAMAALQIILAKWKAEVKFRAVLGADNQFTFYIDIGPRGTTTGKRFEYGKDLTNITRRVDTTQVKSHLYGFGKTIDASSVLEVAASAGATQITVKEGTHFNYVHRVTIGSSPVERVEVQKVIGKVIYLEKPLVNSFTKGTKVATYGSKLTFSEAIWTTPTHPANKALGGKYVSVTPWNGRNRWGIYENSEIEDPLEMLEATWDELQRIKDPLISYEMKVLDLEKLLNYSHEKVRLGDTVTVIDKVIQPNITIQARVIEIKRNLLEPENNEVILGNFIKAIYDDAKRLADAENRLNQIGVDKLVPGEPIPTSVLDGVIETLQNEIKSVAGNVYITEADGILITAGPRETATKALQLKGGIFGIANSKNPDGSFNFRTFGDGDGFTADLITAGTILSDRIAAQSIVIGKLDGTTRDKILNGDSAKTTLDTKSSTWDSAASAVSANSGNWNSAYSTVNLNKSYWDDAYSKVTDWKHPLDSTTINGGKIRAGTIVGDRIYGGTIQGTALITTPASDGANRIQIDNGAVRLLNQYNTTLGGLIAYQDCIAGVVDEIQFYYGSNTKQFTNRVSGILCYGDIAGNPGLIYRGATSWKMVVAD